MEISSNSLVIRTIKRWNFLVDFSEINSLDLCRVARYFVVAILFAIAAITWVMFVATGIAMNGHLLIQGLPILQTSEMVGALPLILVFIMIPSMVTFCMLVLAMLITIGVGIQFLYREYKTLHEKRSQNDDTYEYVEPKPNLLWEYIKSVHGKYCVPVKLV